MRTDLQRQTARLNGAKSRGPITAAGKLRSSQNARRHGLYSRHILNSSCARSPLTRPAKHGRPPSPEEIAHQAYLDYMYVFRLESRILAEEVARQRTLHPDESDLLILGRAVTHLGDTGVIQALYRLHRTVSRNWEIALRRVPPIAEAPAPRSENTFSRNEPGHLHEAASRSLTCRSAQPACARSELRGTSGARAPRPKHFWRNEPGSRSSTSLRTITDLSSQPNSP